MKHIEFQNHGVFHLLAKTLNFHNPFIHTFGHRLPKKEINKNLICSWPLHLTKITGLKFNKIKIPLICSNLMLRNIVSRVYFTINLVSLACTDTYKITLSSSLIYTYWHIRNLECKNVFWGQEYNMVSIWLGLPPDHCLPFICKLCD